MIQPIILYCSTCFFNFLSVKNRAKLLGITTGAGRMIGLLTSNVNTVAVKCIAISVEQDIAHPLNTHLTPLPSGLRYRAPKVQAGSPWEEPDPCCHSCPALPCPEKGALLLLLLLTLSMLQCVLSMCCFLVGIVCWLETLL